MSKYEDRRYEDLLDTAGPRAWWQQLSKKDQADTSSSGSVQRSEGASGCHIDGVCGGRNRNKDQGALCGRRGGEARGSSSSASAEGSGPGNPFADWLNSLKAKMGIQ
eukprot:1159585-Pelagomonas_calceolata.AAC.4